MKNKKMKLVLDEEKSKDIFISWEKQADAVKTKEQLDMFLKKLIKRYVHDYGTIVYAISAGMKATFNFINRSPQGGITGFQASFLGWDLARQFLVHGEKGPLSLKIWERALYPQYEGIFKSTISKDTWKWLQEQAKEKLSSKQTKSVEVEKHWQNIVDGKIPFGMELERDTE